MLIEEHAKITKRYTSCIEDGSFGLIHIGGAGHIMLFNNSGYKGYSSTEFRDYYSKYRYSFCLGKGRPGKLYQHLIESLKLPNVTLGEL